MRRASEAAWSRFHEQVASQGGRAVEAQWLGGHERHRIICAVGHEASPRPSDVNKGTRICRPCSGTDPAVAEAAFRALIAERGGSVAEPLWLGAKKPHRVICVEGHETTQTPSAVVNRGYGCIVCAGKDQGTAWRHFCSLIEGRGGQVLEAAPLGASRPHRVLCPQGHETRAIPSSVRVGLGFCHLCRQTSTARAEQAFRDLVAAQGGRIIENDWLGTKTPHRIICSQGHEASPRPNDAQQTGSLCRVCTGHDAEVSWLEFQAVVAKQGGTVMEAAWRGNKQPHQVICSKGHLCSIRPNNIQQGGSVCRACAYKVWDVFYVVANDAERVVKFGVTSHDPRARLRTHHADGFRRVIKTIVGMPDAFALERSVLTALRIAGMAPVFGREYFDTAALPTILGLVDDWGRVAA